MMNGGRDGAAQALDVRIKTLEKIQDDLRKRAGDRAAALCINPLFCCPTAILGATAAFAAVIYAYYSTVHEMTSKQFQACFDPLQPNCVSGRVEGANLTDVCTDDLTGTLCSTDVSMNIALKTAAISGGLFLLCCAGILLYAGKPEKLTQTEIDAVQAATNVNLAACRHQGKAEIDNLLRLARAQQNLFRPAPDAVSLLSLNNETKLPVNDPHQAEQGGCGTRLLHRLGLGG